MDESWGQQFAADDQIGPDVSLPAFAREQGLANTPLAAAIELLDALANSEVRLGIFKNRQSVDAALAGAGDVNLLVATEDLPKLQKMLVERQAVRGCRSRLHDNFMPDREDWFIPDFPSASFLHIDLHTSIRAGPRFRKFYKVFDYHSFEWRESVFKAGTLPIISLEDDIKVALARSAFLGVILPWPRWSNIRNLIDPMHRVQSGTLEVCCTSGSKSETVSCRTRKLGVRFQANSKDLAKIRFAARTVNGAGLLAAPLDWIVHGVRKVSYLAARIWTRHRGEAAVNRCSPSHGGLVVALVAPDGLGKSSLTEKLTAAFSNHFRCRNLYLGTGDGPGWMIRRLIRHVANNWTKSQLGEPRSVSPEKAGSSEAKMFARACWGLLIALERHSNVQRAARLASRGAIVICDRWPQNYKAGLLDGPSPPCHSKFLGTALLSSLEGKAFKAMEKVEPDLIIHLTAPFEISEGRKPGGIKRQAFVERVRVMSALRCKNPAIVEVDATEEFKEVTGNTHELICRRLASPGRRYEQATTEAFGSGKGSSRTVSDQSTGSSGMSANIMFSVSGQFLFLFTQLGILSSLAHLLGHESMGVFGYALAVAAPLYMIGNLGLRTVQSVDTGGAYFFHEYAWVRLAGIVFAFSSTLLVGYFFVDLVPLSVIAAVALIKAFESVSDFAYGMFQLHEKLNLVFRSLVLRGFLGLSFFVLFVLLGASLATALLAQVLVSLLVACLIDYPAAREASGEIERPDFCVVRLRKLVGEAMPAGGEALFVSIQKSVQRFIVGAFSGLGALGIFTAIDYLQQAGVMLSNSVSHAILGRLSRLYADGNRYANRLVIAQSLVMLVIGGVGVLFTHVYASLMLALLVNHNSPEAETLLLLVAVAIAVRILAGPSASSLYARGMFRHLLYTQAATTILASVLCFALVPRLGLAGAGYAILTAASVRAVLVFVLFTTTFNQSGTARQPLVE